MILEHNYLAFILPVLFGIDMLMTYSYMKILRDSFPEDKDWMRHEMNPVARWAWKRWGLEKGSFVALIVASPIAIMFTVFSYYSSFFLGILIGTYILVLRTHYYAKKHIKNEINRRKTTDKYLQSKKYVVNGVTYNAFDLVNEIKRDIDNNLEKQKLMKK